MISGCQCICGIFIVIHGEVSGKIACPQCGTEWSEKSVTLFSGITYCLEENGRWIRGPDQPKRSSIPIPASRFFGGDEIEC
jgi:hypothetical protein